jgi:hypothetical protein
MIKGQVMEEHNVITISVSHMEKLPMVNKRDMPVDMASRSQLLSGSKLNTLPNEMQVPPILRRSEQ